MGPREIVEILVESTAQVCARHLIEASVHLPSRSTRWVATFRGAMGRQVWRSTGLRNRGAALRLARSWEERARLQRAAQGGAARKPTIRVRPGSGEKEIGLLTQSEVAALLRISERAVGQIERRAFDKIRGHLGQFWREWSTGEIKEAVPGELVLSRAEAAAVYNLARTATERLALSKMIAAMSREKLSDDRQTPWTGDLLSQRNHLPQSSTGSIVGRVPPFPGRR